MPTEVDGSQMQDAVPTLAVLAAFNNTPVTFTNIANLRVKECDRLSALATELNKIREGLAVESETSLLVNGILNWQDKVCQQKYTLTLIIAWQCASH